jgi:hypothetical protein
MILHVLAFAYWWSRASLTRSMTYQVTFGSFPAVALLEIETAAAGAGVI